MISETTSAGELSNFIHAYLPTYLPTGTVPLYLYCTTYLHCTTYLNTQENECRDGCLEAIVINAAKGGSLEFEKMEKELRSLARSVGASEDFDPLVPPLPYEAHAFGDAR